MRIYLVGGAVRDELLGREVQDKDYVVLNSSPEDFLRRFPKAKKVGKKEPVYIYKGSEYTISKARTIFEDLQQRDLTVNALAKSQAGTLVALPSSLHDLKHGLLRQVSDINFYHDPLRVYRTARMVACYPGFKLEPSLKRLLIHIGRTNLLWNISPERIARETLKAFSCSGPGEMFQILKLTDNLSPWLYELKQFLTRSSRTDNHASYFDYLTSLMNELAGKAPLLVWMGVCHGFAVRQNRPASLPDSFHPDNRSAVVAQTLGQRLKFPKKYIQAGESTARWLTAGLYYDQLPSEIKVDLLTDLNSKGLLNYFFELIDFVQRSNFYQQAQRELMTILSVKLPFQDRELGHLSGRILKRIRCQALDNPGHQNNKTEPDRDI